MSLPQHSRSGWSGFWHGQDDSTPKWQVQARNWFMVLCWTLLIAVAVGVPILVGYWILFR